MTREERWYDLWLNKTLTFAEIAEAIGPNMEGEVQASVRQNLRQQLKAKSDEPCIRRNARPIDTDELQQRQGGEPDLSGYPEAIRGKHDKVYRSLWDKLTVPTELTGQERYTARGWMSCAAGLIRQREDGLWERVPQGEKA